MVSFALSTQNYIAIYNPESAYHPKHSFKALVIAVLIFAAVLILGVTAVGLMNNVMALNHASEQYNNEYQQLKNENISLANELRALTSVSNLERVSEKLALELADAKYLVSSVPIFVSK